MNSTDRKFQVRSKVWLYPGFAGWHFVSLDLRQTQEIKERFGHLKRGWGSLPVKVTLGKSVWRTSIFPDKEGPYVMGLKALVRKQEDIHEGDEVVFDIEIMAE